MTKSMYSIQMGKTHNASAFFLSKNATVQVTDTVI